jgi:hypothetical protein
VRKCQLKPLVRASSSRPLTKRTGYAITRSLEEELFRVADVLSEGSCRSGRNGTASYFGSTMISIDLTKVDQRQLGPLDSRSYEQLAQTVEGSVRVRLRALRIAYREVVQRVADRPFGTAQVETKVRLCGTQLHLDVDLEVPLEVSLVRTSR